MNDTLNPERVRVGSVSLETILPIRHRVMWPDKPLSFVQIPGDAVATHLAVFVDEQPVSVVSLFRERDEWQFRKLATLPEHRKKGYATLLLNEVFRLANEAGIPRIWCNARKQKIAYYARMGMLHNGETFYRDTQEYWVMEIRKPNK